VVPGTVCISQGAWHDADMYGDRVDKGGCINTLTTHRPSPLAKGNPQHSNICQVTKA
jgi:Tat-targeted selenate reductase subunit YnfE